MMRKCKIYEYIPDKNSYDTQAGLIFIPIEYNHVPVPYKLLGITNIDNSVFEFAIIENELEKWEEANYCS